MSMVFCFMWRHYLNLAVWYLNSRNLMMRSILWAYVSQCFVHFHLDTNGVFNMQKAKRMYMDKPFCIYVLFSYLHQNIFYDRVKCWWVKTYKTNNRTNQAIATVGWILFILWCLALAILKKTWLPFLERCQFRWRIGR